MYDFSKPESISRVKLAVMVLDSRQRCMRSCINRVNLGVPCVTQFSANLVRIVHEAPGSMIDFYAS